MLSQRKPTGGLFYFMFSVFPSAVAQAIFSKNEQWFVYLQVEFRISEDRAGSREMGVRKILRLEEGSTETLCAHVLRSGHQVGLLKVWVLWQEQFAFIWSCLKCFMWHLSSLLHWRKGSQWRQEFLLSL